VLGCRFVSLERDCPGCRPSIDHRGSVGGDARNRFAQYIRNGETAVFIRAFKDEQVEFASEILKLYLPIKIEIVPREDEPRATGTP